MVAKRAFAVQHRALLGIIKVAPHGPSSSVWARPADNVSLYTPAYTTAVLTACIPMRVHVTPSEGHPPPRCPAGETKDKPETGWARLLHTHPSLPDKARCAPGSSASHGTAFPGATKAFTAASVVRAAAAPLPGRVGPQQQPL